MKFIRILIFFFFIMLLNVNCGTGPWFIRKNIYETYKNPIYKDSKNSLRFDGYYLQTGDLRENAHIRYAIIFNKNGYFTKVWLSNKDLKNEINKKITQVENTLKDDLGWWRVEKDSLILENYAENKIGMSTWNYFEKGLVIDSLHIELKSEDERIPITKYEFIKSDSLPTIFNTGRYLKKDWYNKNLNKDRLKI
ncbi:hypothetical protein [Yeosuana marina]|uniref:hypothetical protein n=1 Tax=Yeosuana marina TaxID=1565536 RepID=UPI0014220C6A|nr:hypothetical protein [Yeosuana marina]